MYKENDYVIYGKQVCRVEKIEKKDELEYYILRPVKDESLKIQIPTTTDKIRNIISKKDIEKFESELKKYQEEIENYESENQKLEKELDVYKYKNLINAVNTMNKFYENEQKNSKILEEIKLTKEQIDKLRLKEHVIKYIQENANDIGDTNKNEIKKDEDDYNIKTEKISQNIFKGLNTNINNEKETFKKEDEDGNYTGFNLMDNDKDEILGENKENKIKELNEKIQNAVNVSL